MRIIALQRLPQCRWLLLRQLSSVKTELTKEQKDRLRSALPSFSVEREEGKPTRPSALVSLADEAKENLDEIRARGFLKVKKPYNPPEDLGKIVAAVAQANALEVGADFPNLSVKCKVLSELSAQLDHSVPNSQLHRITNLAQTMEFYQTPVANVTEYVKLARDEAAPDNLCVRETPVRFHPNDRDAFHKGVTAFPGSGGQVISLRNKRLYRQFRPKKEWFDYEEQSFDHEPLDKGMPWDPEVAAKMDKYTDRKFQKDGFKSI